MSNSFVLKTCGFEEIYKFWGLLIIDSDKLIKRKK